MRGCLLLTYYGKSVYAATAFPAQDRDGAAHPACAGIRFGPASDVSWFSPASEIGII